MFLETVCVCVYAYEHVSACVLGHTGRFFFLLNGAGYVTATSLLWETWVVVQVMRLSFCMSLSKWYDLHTLCTVLSISQILGCGHVVFPTWWEMSSTPSLPAWQWTQIAHCKGYQEMQEALFWTVKNVSQDKSTVSSLQPHWFLVGTSKA